MKYGIFQFSNEPDAMERHALRIFEARLRKRGVAADPECTILVVHNEQCAAEEFRFSGSCGGKNLQLAKMPGFVQRGDTRFGVLAYNAVGPKR